ncbi:hypothetical protein [Nonomuraea sp. CA-141351]|uniref:hypothetical protein n=1 Tax=Nonomuraea sp. CA-141351 TaxID=3239996 RepID=UPI003D8C2D20
MSADLMTGSPLDIAETSFRLLATGPGGLTLDCAGLAPDLPQGEVGLLELRRLLTSRAVVNDTRDAVWRELVTRSRQLGAAWTVAAVGMAIPALRMIAGALTRHAPTADVADLDTEILTGYLRALQRIDLAGPNVRPRLCGAAQHAGERAVRDYASEAGRHLPLHESAPPPRPWGHPDLVLIDAVASGVLSELDAELIGLTRLERMPLRQAAARLGLSEAAARKRRQRCEPQLIAALRSGEIGSALSPTITSSAPRRVEDTSPVRSRGLPDAEAATDPKGGRDVAPGSARTFPSGNAWDVRQPATRRAKPCRGRRKALRRRMATTAVVTAVAILLVVLVAMGAFAAAPSDAAAPTDLNTVFTNIRNWLIGLLATLATLMLTVGGLRYLVAGGDPGEVQKAKAALKAAAFGYGLAVLAPIFVNVLKSVVGG